MNKQEFMDKINVITDGHIVDNGDILAIIIDFIEEISIHRYNEIYAYIQREIIRRDI